MTDIRIDTPESVDVAYEPAGFGSRFAAALLDGLIQWGATVLLLVLALLLSTVSITSAFKTGDFGAMGGILLAILLAILGFLFFGYKLLLEAFWNGQTVGKRAMSIRVIQQSGMPAGFLQILVRNLMRVVDYLPLNYLVGSIAVLASRRHQRLGDMVAGTVVVRERRVLAPVVTTAFTRPPQFDVQSLRERVLRLSEQELEVARSFWQRRSQLLPASRSHVAIVIAESLAQRLGWPEPVSQAPEEFIEAVLVVRSQPM